MQKQTNTTTAPRVSVVIPTHNCLEYLPAALDSIFIQDLEVMEILVIDDGSTDGTWDWLQTRSQQEPRITPLRLNGVGPAAARNHAISRCLGDLVAFLDADDVWRPGKLTSQLAFHQQHPEVVFSFTDYEHVAPDGTGLGGCFQFWPVFHRKSRNQQGFTLLENAAPSLFAENIAGTSTVIVRRDALQNAKGFDTTLHSAEDWDLWLKMATSGPVGYSTQVGSTYLMRPGSETRKSLSRLEYLEKIIHRHEKTIGQQDSQAVGQAYARLATGWAEYYRDCNRPLAAMFQHLRALCMAPSRRALRALLSDAVALIR